MSKIQVIMEQDVLPAYQILAMFLIQFVSISEDVAGKNENYDDHVIKIVIKKMMSNG